MEERHGGEQTHKPMNPVLPFFHLRSDGFWYLIPHQGKDQILNSVTQIRSKGQLQELVLGARLDEALFLAMQDPRERDKLRMVLIERHFAPELRPRLVELGVVTAEALQYSFDLLNATDEHFKLRGRHMKESSAEYIPEARSVAFCQVVLRAYDFTCALCRIRVVTPEGRSAAVAAHIVPWSESYNDDPRNGLALCGLHHWTFDEGLVTISSDHRVIVSKLVSADTRGTEPLLGLSGQEISLPEATTLWPAEEALAWHREHTFRKGIPARLV